MAENQIIVIKKKKGGHGHHGGAWKVAYADFVTAMMALFIVLWLMNTSKPVQDAVSGYFRDPKGTSEKKGSISNGASDTNATRKTEYFDKLKEDLQKSLAQVKGFDKLKNQIEITITPEGLRIEMMESPNGTFFENGKAQPTEALIQILKVLSTEAGKLSNPISIEGHTDAAQYKSPDGYSNWELSADRANMARRIMENSGVRSQQVVQVRGYADRNLRKPQLPFDASNRRVSIIIQRPDQPAAPDATFDGKLPALATTPATGTKEAPAPEGSSKPAEHAKEAKEIAAK